MHWAVRGGRKEAIETLVYLRGKISVIDTQGRRPIDLVLNKEDYTSRSIWGLLYNLERQKSPIEHKPLLPSRRPPKNLVFKGGGPKGIAYIGVLQVLEEKKLLDGVRRVAGTSAGAITATALAMNLNASEILKILQETSLKDFLDHPLTQISFKKAKKNVSFSKLLSIAVNPKKALTKMHPLSLFYRLWHSTGICEGEVFRNWIENIIAKQTGITHCTFGELATLIQQGKPFRHLHVFSLKTGKQSGLFHFHSDNRDWKDLVISDAVRASMSIPGVFKTHILHFKDAYQRRYPRPDLGSFMDGGMVYNLPIEVFDEKGYIDEEVPEEEKAYPIHNPDTLGFSLFSPKEPKPDKPITTIKDVLLGVLNIYKDAEILIRQNNSSNTSRVIEIDNKGVGLLDFDLKKEEERKLIDSGRFATRTFFPEKTANESTSLSFREPTIKSKDRFVKLRPPLPNFIPRQEFHKQIEQTLLFTSWEIHTPCSLCVLSGFGGVGKSALACSFANTHLTRFSLICWIDSATDETLFSSYRGLAYALKMRLDKNETLQTLRDKVHGKLDNYRADKPWLLVFDNVEKKIPLPDRGGSLLITTKRDDLYEGKPLKIGSFSPEEGHTLLMQASPTSTPEERKALLTELEFFPLALGQAAAYLEKESVTIAAYLQEMREGGSFVKDAKTEQDDRTVEASWRVTFERIQNNHPKAWECLELISYFYAENIPESCLQKWFLEKGESSATARQTLQDCIDTLRSYALIRYNRREKTLSCHRVVQEIVRSKQEPSEQILNVPKVMDILGSSYNFSPKTFAEKEANRALLSHGKAILTHYEGIVFPLDTFHEDFFHTLSWYIHLQQDLAQTVLEEDFQDQLLSHQYYIPTDTILSNQVRTPLSEKWQDFLNEPKDVVFLLLGESGAGKSLTLKIYQRRLWEAFVKEYKGWMPFRIELKRFPREKVSDCIAVTLKNEYQLTPKQIAYLQKNASALFLFDGIDEIPGGLSSSLVDQLSLWPQAKALISCRSQYLTDHPDCRTYFKPMMNTNDNNNNQVSPCGHQEETLAPFSSEQIQQYLSHYQRVETNNNSKEEETPFSDETVQQLLTNPFVLSIYCQALPQLHKENDTKLTRSEIYEGYVRHWFVRQSNHLKNVLGDGAITEEGQDQFIAFARNIAFRHFIGDFQEEAKNSLWLQMFCQDVAEAPRGRTSRPHQRRGAADYSFIHKFEKNRGNHLWLQLFQQDDIEAHLARAKCPLQRRAGAEYSFIHKSFWEYFVADFLWDTLRNNPTEAFTLFNKRLLPEEPAILDFLADRWKSLPSEEKEKLEELLFVCVQSSEEIAAANAITLLNWLKTNFSGKNLRGISVPKANLNNGIFHYTDLSGANFRNVQLARTQLVHSNLQNADLTGVNFDQWLSLEAESNVGCMAYHPNKDNVALGLDNGNIEIWDPTRIKRLTVLTGHKGAVNSICYSPDGTQIFSVSGRREIFQWSTQGEVTHVFTGHEQIITDIRCSPDGMHFLTNYYCKDTTIRLWNVNKSEITHIFTGHNESVRCVCYSPGGNYFLSGSEDRTIKQWNVNGGEATHTFIGHNGWVQCVCYSSDGKNFLSGSDDKTIRLWNASGGEAKRVFRGHYRQVLCVCYSPDGSFFLSGSYDNTIRKWSIEGGTAIHVFKGHTSWVENISYSHDGMRILSKGCDATVRQWRADVEENALSLVGHMDSVNSVCYSPCGKWILSGSNDKTIRQWNANGGKATHIFTGHEAWVTCVCYSPDGTCFLSGSLDTTIRLWNVNGGEAKRVFRGHYRQVLCVCYSPDGKSFLSGSDDKTIRLWNVNIGSALHVFRGHESYVASVCYSPDGKSFLSGSWDKTIRQWNVNGDEATLVFTGHEEEVSDVCYSLDGAHFLSTDKSTIRQWNAETGAVIRTFDGFDNVFEKNCYNPDGKYFVSTYGQAVVIWDIQTGVCLGTLHGHNSSINSVDWHQNGGIVTGSSDHTVAMWREMETPQGKQWCLAWQSDAVDLVPQDCLIEGAYLSRENAILLQQRGAKGKYQEPKKEEKNTKGLCMTF